MGGRNHSFNLGEILSKPFQIIWKHKILWLFGVIGTMFGVLNGFITNRYLSTLMEYLPTDMILTNLIYNHALPTGLFNQLDHQFVQGLEIVFGLSLICYLLQFFIALIFQACIIRSVKLIDEGASSVGFSAAIKEGWKPLGKLVIQILVELLSISVIIFLIEYGIILLVKGIEAKGIIHITFMAFLCTELIIEIPAIFFISLYLKAFKVSLAHDNTGVFVNFKKGFRTIGKSFGNFIIFHFIFSVSIFLLNLIPDSFFAVSEMSIFKTIGFFSGFLTVVGYLLRIIIQSFLTTYWFTSWTLAFRRVAYPPVVEVPPLPVQTP